MNISRFGAVALAITLFVPLSRGAAGESAQTVTLTSETQVPGADLKPGTYTFAVEDRLPDRAIVRISDAQNSAQHYLVLAVPDSKISASSSDHVVFFKATDNKQPVKAWQCSDCSAPLEFVYSKAEAVKITGDTAQTVMAVDPSYDKLPSNLSADDMKVVTLWLLSPERVTADNTGQGVKAAKYAAPSPAPPADTTVASNATPASTPAPTASTPAPTASTPPTEAAAQAPAVAAADQTVHTRRHLPKTASNSYLYALLGLVLLGSAFGTRLLRTHQA